jgi:hypothetical protein
VEKDESTSKNSFTQYSLAGGKLSLFTYDYSFLSVQSVKDFFTSEVKDIKEPSKLRSKVKYLFSDKSSDINSLSSLASTFTLMIIAFCRDWLSSPFHINSGIMIKISSLLIRFNYVYIFIDMVFIKLILLRASDEDFYSAKEWVHAEIKDSAIKLTQNIFPFIYYYLNEVVNSEIKTELKDKNLILLRRNMSRAVIFEENAKMKNILEKSLNPSSYSSIQINSSACDLNNYVDIDICEQLLDILLSQPTSISIANITKPNVYLSSAYEINVSFFISVIFIVFLFFLTEGFLFNHYYDYSTIKIFI